VQAYAFHDTHHVTSSHACHIIIRMSRHHKHTHIHIRRHSSCHIITCMSHHHTHVTSSYACPIITNIHTHSTTLIISHHHTHVTSSYACHVITNIHTYTFDDTHHITSSHACHIITNMSHPRLLTESHARKKMKEKKPVARAPKWGVSRA
jgi:hypothetical protein